MFHGVRTLKEVIKVKQVFPDAAVVKNLPAMQEMWVGSLNREDPWRMAWQPTPVFLPGKDRGAWGSAVHGVAKSWTRLSLNIHTQLSMTLRVTSTNKIVFFSPWK